MVACLCRFCVLTTALPADLEAGAQGLVLGYVGSTLDVIQLAHHAISQLLGRTVTLCRALTNLTSQEVQLAQRHPYSALLPL